MAVEIERKFLMDADTVAAVIQGVEGKPIHQGYLSTGSWMTRVRTYGDKGYLTVKSTGAGLRRSEFEYEIPLEDAQAMLQAPGLLGRLAKTRYCIPAENKLTFEIDVFEGPLRRLVVAEIELPDEATPVPPRPWLGPELSNLKAFSNESLARAGLPESFGVLVSAFHRQRQSRAT